MGAPCDVTFSWEPHKVGASRRDPSNGPVYCEKCPPRKISWPVPCFYVPHRLTIYPRVGLLVWAAFFILSYHAASAKKVLYHAANVQSQSPSNEQATRPCPCLRPSVPTSQFPANDSLASNSTLEDTPGVHDLGTIFTPGLFQDGICNGILGLFPHSWNTTVEQGEGAAPPSKAVAMALNSGCHRTCAIVANGYRLLGSGHGPEIDQADVIIRMNEAPVRGYENDVGNRTTIRFVHPKALAAWIGIQLKARAHRDWEPDLYVMRCTWWCFTMFGYMHKGVPVPPAVLSRNHIRDEYPPSVTDRLVVASLNIYKITDLFTHNKPTTGSMSVAMAMMMCEKVRLYGYGLAGEIFYGHYFTTKSKKNTKARPNVNNLDSAGGFKHNFAGEWQLWKSMHEAGMLTVVP